MNIEFISDAYTIDGLKLPMVHFESKEKDICVICIHGMCGTIIDNYFATVWGKFLSEKNIGFIYEHNRGHSLENDIVMKDGSFKRYGCMYEIFEDSVYDIDLAIETAKNKGYKRIVLLGHSYGCNKVIYHYYKKHPDILGIILASAPDMIGSHLSIQASDYKELLKEAKNNIDNNEPEKLLHKMIEDYMYMSSKTYYNWFNENSNLNNLPVISNPKSWKQFESIDVPILTFSGSNEEEYYLRLDLLKEKAINCKDFKYQIIENTGHTYKNKEKEIGNLIYQWIQNLKEKDKEEYMKFGPDKNSKFPNPNIKEICFIKNVITRPNIIVGDYTYYDDKNGADKFEKHVTHHYEFNEDKLIIGNFCQIASGIEFIMNGANHCMSRITTYPFNIMGSGWEKTTPPMEDLPLKGDTVIGNDVWIGQNVTVMPGVHIGNGAIIGANSVVASDIPPYHIAVGNPCKVIKKRFDDELIDYLEKIQWWNWSEEKIFNNLEILCSNDLDKIKKID